MWFVRGQPAVAVFPTPPRSADIHTLDHIGQPSPHNGVPHDLLDPLEALDVHTDLSTITSSCFQSCPPSPLLHSAEDCFLDSAPSSVVLGTPVAKLNVPSHDDDDDLVSLSSDTEFCLLMPHLWGLCPDAHFVLVVELLKLGSASRTNAKKFREVRVTFMSTFLSYVATNQSSVPTSRLAAIVKYLPCLHGCRCWILQLIC